MSMRSQTAGILIRQFLHKQFSKKCTPLFLTRSVPVQMNVIFLFQACAAFDCIVDYDPEEGSAKRKLDMVRSVYQFLWCIRVIRLWEKVPVISTKY